MAVPVRRSLLLRSLARRSGRAAGTDGGLEVQIRLRATAHPPGKYTRNSRRSPLACLVGTALLAAWVLPADLEQAWVLQDRPLSRMPAGMTRTCHS